MAIERGICRILQILISPLDWGSWWLRSSDKHPIPAKIEVSRSAGLKNHAMDCMIASDFSTAKKCRACGAWTQQMAKYMQLANASDKFAFYSGNYPQTLLEVV